MVHIFWHLLSIKDEPTPKSPVFLNLRLFALHHKGIRRKSASPALFAWRSLEACCSAQHIRQSLGRGNADFHTILNFGRKCYFIFR